MFVHLVLIQHHLFIHHAILNHHNCIELLHMTYQQRVKLEGKIESLSPISHTCNHEKSIAQFDLELFSKAWMHFQA